MRIVVAGLVLAVLAMSASTADGQTDRRRGVEVGVRLEAVGPIHFDGAAANLTTADGRPYALFRLDNSLGSEIGLEGHVSVPLLTAFRIEGAVGFARPTLRTRVSGDIEDADPVTVLDRLSRLTLEAAVVVDLRRGTSHVWFVRAGGGVTRGLTSERTLLAKGTVATVGAGVKYWMRRGPHRRGGFGIDAEGRVVTRWQGLALDSGRLHVVPAATAGLFFGF